MRARQQAIEAELRSTLPAAERQKLEQAEAERQEGAVQPLHSPAGDQDRQIRGEGRDQATGERDGARMPYH